MRMMKHGNIKKFIFPFFRLSKNSQIKGFSLLEMLIVIMIVGILFVAFRGLFQVKNKDVFYGQACVESIYGQVNNFLYAAISSKSLNSGGTQVFPDIYSVYFDPTLQNISLKYTIAGDQYIHTDIPIRDQNNIQYCNNNNTTLLLSGDIYEIHINKGLQENKNIQGFSLSGVAITGENIFRGCNGQENECKNISYFITDIRTITIQKYMCLHFDTTGDCLEWDN